MAKTYWLTWGHFFRRPKSPFSPWTFTPSIYETLILRGTPTITAQLATKISKIASLS